MSIEATTVKGSLGVPMKRKEDPRFLQGKGHYVDDLSFPGMLYMALVRSPYPHARIASIDTSKAEAAPGVHAVISVLTEPDMPWFEDGKLFDWTVRYLGDEVAAVAAFLCSTLAGFINGECICIDGGRRDFFWG